MNELPIETFKIFCEYFYEDFASGKKLSQAFDNADRRVGRDFVIFLKQETIAPKTKPVSGQTQGS